MKHAALALMLLVSAATSIAQSRAEEATLWIGPNRPGPQASTWTVQKEFTIPEIPSAAMLRIATDFCEATVELNGKVVWKATPYSQPVAVSVQRACLRGDNELVVRCRANGGPAAMGLELELIDPAGEVSLIRSDDTWHRVDAPPRKVSTFGPIDQEPWWHVKVRPSTNAFDEYNQWSEAKTTDGSALAAKFQLPPGFELDVVYHVPAEYGSWISMTMDDKGRLIVGKEKSGLLRLTLGEAGKAPEISIINSELQGSHGVLWTPRGLFVNASDSKGFYRLRDTDGDDSFDQVLLLRSVPGGRGDHGRNDLVEAADGAIYLIHGDAVDLPDGFQSRVPVTREFDANEGRPKGGHVIRTDAEASTWEVVASGLRNPYGIAIHRDGELFTYDADSERHVGLPWYRPTRMNHLVPGADYGWRSRGELPWPIYHADILPPNVLIGRGSPTSVKFGYSSNFPPPYRNAFFAPDWAFGRVFAVHVIPRGASYSMHPETFLRGRPFNVVDMEFAPDGSLFILTGGYETRSVLYRLKYTGARAELPLPTPQQEAREAYSTALRALRVELESFQREAAEAVAFSWQHLNHADRWIRHAARVAIEHQPVESWSKRLWNESRPDFLMPALLAYVRVAPEASPDKVGDRIARISIDVLSRELQRTAARIAQILLQDESKLSAGMVQVFSQFEELYPSGDRALDRELCSLLASRDSVDVVAKTLRILPGELSQEDALHYLMVLSTTKVGWNDGTRTEFFRLLRGTRLFKGDEGLPQITKAIEADALANVPTALQSRFAALLVEDNTESEAVATTRPFARVWRSTDLDLEDRDATLGDVALGQRVFREALCNNCHRLGADGLAFGPDLTGVAARFSRREILDSILHPSATISSRYINHVIETVDGRTTTGQVVWNGFRKSIIRVATDPMRMDKVTEISKSDIVAYVESPISPMPEGLLNSFSKQEILGLLAYIEAEAQQ